MNELTLTFLLAIANVIAFSLIGVFTWYYYLDYIEAKQRQIKEITIIVEKLSKFPSLINEHKPAILNIISTFNQLFVPPMSRQALQAFATQVKNEAKNKFASVQAEAQAIVEEEVARAKRVWTSGEWAVHLLGWITAGFTPLVEGAKKWAAEVAAGWKQFENDWHKVGRDISAGWKKFENDWNNFFKKK
jgi:hypothetical protein